MITEEILETLISIDSLKEVGLNENIISLQEKIEKASTNLRYLSKYVKAKKIMSILGEKDSDIYVQCLAKSGTTLTQMILYQMTTEGEMNFNHIYDVSPWLGQFGEFTQAEILAFAEKIPNFGKRRIFKSHFGYPFFKDVKKGKFVYIIRNALDQTLSFYHHHKNYYNPDLEFESFVNKGMFEGWFRNNTEWIKNESELNIIYIHYEDLVERKGDIIEKLADFLKIDLNNEKLERIIERSSFPFMKKNEHKFGEQPGREDSKIYNKFIRKGEIGAGESHFTKEQILKYYELSNDYLGNHDLTKRYFIR